MTRDKTGSRKGREVACRACRGEREPNRKKKDLKERKRKRA